MIFRFRFYSCFGVWKI